MLPPGGDLNTLQILVATILLVGVIDAAIAAAWILRQGAVAAGTKPPLFAPRWSLVDVWIAAQVIIALLIVISLGELALLLWTRVLRFEDLGALMTSHASRPVVLFVLSSLLIQNIITILVTAAFIWWKYRLPLRSIGLPAVPGRRIVLIGIGAGLVILLVGNGFQAAIEWVLGRLLPPDVLHRMIESSRAMSPEPLAASLHGKPGLFALLLLGGAVFAPIGEELFFRGFLYNSAKHRLGIAGGVLLSAFMFGLAHGGPLLVLAIVPMGVLMALAYEWTGSLWVTIIMHAVNNGIGLAILYHR